jgi:hypothetical protein
MKFVKLWVTERRHENNTKCFLLPAVMVLLCDSSGITVHGEDGLGGARPALEESDTQFGEDTASEFIYKACKKASGEITLVALGPLTNIALCLRMSHTCVCVRVCVCVCVCVCVFVCVCVCMYVCM